MAHGAPAPTPGSKSEARKDARSRGWRTALQGAISTALVAVAAVVTDQVVPGEIIDWPTLGLAAATAGGTALAAWVQRRLEGGTDQP
ncbi:hypothetical protein [Nocardiopsis oceani]